MSIIRRLAKERIAVIQQTVRELKEEEEQIRRELSVLANDPATSEESAKGEYAEMSFGEASLRYLFKAGPSDAHQIATALEAGGLKSTSNTVHAVKTALRRYAKQGKATLGDDGVTWALPS